MNFAFHPMTEILAREVASWRYDSPYALYNFDPAALDADLAVLTDPSNLYYSVQEEGGTLLAFICFGEEAQVAGGDYPEDALDVGCGLRPDLTGLGMGPSIVQASLDLGRTLRNPTTFRATVAAFNERALKATCRAGFRPARRFKRPSDGLEFVILLRDRKEQDDRVSR